jgi:hypothetical protein
MRPSTYKPRYCKQVVALSRKGFSQVEIARALGVLRQTMRLWGRTHCEFGDALALAKASALAYWERRGHKALLDSCRSIPKQGPEFNKRTRRKHRRRARDRFNTPLWIKEMERRFPDEYGKGVRPVAPDVAQPPVRRVIVWPTD